MRQQGEDVRGRAMRKRAMRALGVVALGLGVLPLTNLLIASEEASSALAAEDLALSFELSLRDPYATLGQVEGYLDALPSANAAEIDQEAKIPPHASNVRWNQGSGVLAFEMEGDANQVLAELLDAWQGQGWQSVPLGDACGATLVKAEGTYRWMAVTAAQVGSQTCIVGKVAT